jgi:hypothetical protein
LRGTVGGGGGGAAAKLPPDNINSALQFIPLAFEMLQRVFKDIAVLV